MEMRTGSRKQVDIGGPYDGGKATPKQIRKVILKATEEKVILVDPRGVFHQITGKNLKAMAYAFAHKVRTQGFSDKDVSLFFDGTACTVANHAWCVKVPSEGRKYLMVALPVPTSFSQKKKKMISRKSRQNARPSLARC